MAWSNTWASGWSNPSHLLNPWLQLGSGGQALITVIAALVFSGLIFSGLLVFRSSDQDDLLAQGQRDLAEGRVARAVHTLRQLVRQNSKNFEGQLALGKAYLTLGDVDSAQEAFSKALRLKQPSGTSHTPQALHNDVALALAQGQLQLTEGNYSGATEPLQTLLLTYPKQLSVADRTALQSALTDAHQAWGDSLLKPASGKAASFTASSQHASSESANGLSLKLTHLKEAILHYQQALQTVQTYGREKALKQKLLALLEQWLEGAPNEGARSPKSSADKTSTPSTLQQSPQEAIEILEPLVRWLPEADLMIRLGDLHLQQAQDPQASAVNAKVSDSPSEAHTPYDTAIGWYRRAYQAAPHGVGVKLAHVLTLRGKVYLKAHQDALANADFKEADLLLGRTADDSTLSTPSLLYPVSIKTIAVAPHLNRDAQTLQPSATITLASEAHRPLQHLMARVQILSGSKVLGEWTNVIATSKKPLEADGLPLSKRTWSVQLKDPVSLNILTSGGSLRVTTSISYDMPEEGKKPSWELKRVQEIRIQPKKVAAPASPATEAPPLPSAPAMPSAITSAPSASSPSATTAVSSGTSGRPNL